MEFAPFPLILFKSLSVGDEHVGEYLLSTTDAPKEVDISSPLDNEEVQDIKQVIQFMIKKNSDTRNNIELVLYKLREQQLTREKQNIVKAKDQEITEQQEIQRIKQEMENLEREKDDKIAEEREKFEEQQQKVQRLKEEKETLVKEKDDMIAGEKFKLEEEKEKVQRLKEEKQVLEKERDEIIADERAKLDEQKQKVQRIKEEKEALEKEKDNKIAEERAKLEEEKQKVQRLKEEKQALERERDDKIMEERTRLEEEKQNVQRLREEKSTLIGEKQELQHLMKVMNDLNNAHIEQITILKGISKADKMREIEKDQDFKSKRDKIAQTMTEHVDRVSGHLAGLYIVWSELAAMNDNVLKKWEEKNDSMQERFKRFRITCNESDEHKAVADDFIKELETVTSAMQEYLKKGMEETKETSARLASQIGVLSRETADIEGQFRAIFPNETMTDHDREKHDIETKIRRLKIFIQCLEKEGKPENECLRELVVGIEEGLRAREAELRSLEESEE